MALQLTKVSTRVFSGTKGATVVLNASPSQSSSTEPANIVSVTYNGATVKASPFKITLASGNHGMVVVYASTQGTQVSINEVDSAASTNTQSLAKTFFDIQDPSVVIVLKVA